MGKPFSSELELLTSTISYSETLDVSCLKQYIHGHILNPFIVVGSGGSFSVAQIIALVINDMGGFAQAITPFELMGFSSTLRKVNVLFFSAGGGNPDILNAYTFCKQMETHSTFILCLTEDSKLVQLASGTYGDNSFFECRLPSGKDGFLAVNSTVLAVSLLRKVLGSYSSTVIIPTLPSEIDNCLSDTSIVALGGRWTLPAVTDFESKCTEAGLINVMPADLRNFAHGRHHWLAKHPDASVICLVAVNELELARKTLDILPGHIHKSILLTKCAGIEATNEMLLYVFQMIQKLGKIKGIDPGKPGVPRFGSQIYRLNYRLSNEAEKNGLIGKSIIDRMAKRKHEANPCMEYSVIERAASEYIKRLSTICFRAIVIDYDNTIISGNCTTSDSYSVCMNYINSFLQNKTGICFATGRGKSIRSQLLKVILPDCYDRVYVSYYNGAITLPLSAELPPFSDSISPKLLNVNDYVLSMFPQSAENITIRNECITYEGDIISLETIHTILSSAILRGELSDIKIAKSDHSIDVFPLNVSKNNALVYMKKLYGDNVLCVGDAGNEFGNDYELLNSKYSLSADSVSVSLESCWNIASLGLKGPTATSEYLKNLSIMKKGLRFSKKYLQLT